MQRTAPDLMARAAAFLLAGDSKASYVIEGERPPQDRIQRWGQAIGEAGHRPLTATSSCTCSGSLSATHASRIWAGVRKADLSATRPRNQCADPRSCQRAARKIWPAWSAAWSPMQNQVEKSGLDPVVAAVGGRLWLCLYSSVRGWQRPDTPLASPSHAGTQRLQSARHHLPGLGCFSGTHRALSGSAWSTTHGPACF